MNRRPAHRGGYRTEATLLAAAAWVDPYDPLRPLEEQFRQAARQVAQQLGYRCWHQHDSRRSDVGWPDEVWARPPRLIFAELKAPDGEVTEDQRDTLELLSRCGKGLETYVLRSLGDRARDQASIAQLLAPYAVPTHSAPRGTTSEAHL